MALQVRSAFPQVAADAPAFDVVSITVDHEGTGGAGDRFPKHGTWHWTRIPLSFLIMYAYDVPLKQVESVPRSLQGSDPAFDITAKMPADVTESQFRLMLQSMLADRFKLAIHREMRDSPVNTIEIAKGGSKLQPASGDCVAAERSATLQADRHRCGEVTARPEAQDGILRWRYSG